MDASKNISDRKDKFQIANPSILHLPAPISALAIINVFTYSYEQIEE